MQKNYLYRFVRILITPLIKLFFRPTIIGQENIPLNEKIILAGNHTSYFDPVLLMSCTKRTIHFLAKIELTKGPLGPLFRGLGIIPVDRKKRNSKALSKAEEYLQHNEVIGIYPEATINHSNDPILPFKTGAVRMAHDTNTLIVPFIITGKYKLFQRSVKIEFLKAHKVKTNNLEKENKILEDIIADALLGGWK